MISYLSGTIIHLEEKNLILKTNDIGYKIHITSKLATALQKNQQIEIFTHTHVREDQLALYGFPTLNELNFFELLLTVSGIGPKLGLEILANPISSTQNAILTDNIENLTQISGLGKKTAQRLILELKNKIEPSEIFENSANNNTAHIHPDVISALTSLGYSRYQVSNVLKNLTPEIKKTEEIVRYFLKNV